MFQFIKYATTIIKYGTSYAIATSFFPPQIAKNVIELYQFVRIPDNIVDDHAHEITISKHYSQAFQKLEMMSNYRTTAYQNNMIDDWNWWNYVRLFKNNNIDSNFSVAFYDAMKQDCVLHRYKTYEDLQKYMYGSAIVIGMMMNRLMWVEDLQTDNFASKLWEAMQMTNFLRDIREDYTLLDRIYVPEEILNRYGINHQIIIKFCDRKIDYNSSERRSFVAAMKDMIVWCRKLYRESEKWIEWLPDDCKKAVIISARLYEWILDNIERNEYDIFTKSAKTTLITKVKILLTYQLKKWH